MQKAAQAYFQTQVTTTSQGDILIMLFDGALKFLAQARERMAARDFAKKGILISKALDVLAELQSSLNPQKGGDLAENLRRIYLICQTKLLAANMRMDVKQLDEVVNILSGIRDAFAQINTPGVSPVSPPPGEAARATGMMPPPAGGAPSAGASVHRAFAAYGQAKREPVAG
jgi:flagellar protein FliS